MRLRDLTGRVFSIKLQRNLEVGCEAFRSMRNGFIIKLMPLLSIFSFGLFDIFRSLSGDK